MYVYHELGVSSVRMRSEAVHVCVWHGMAWHTKIPLSESVTAETPEVIKARAPRYDSASYKCFHIGQCGGQHRARLLSSLSEWRRA